MSVTRTRARARALPGALAASAAGLTVLAALPASATTTYSTAPQAHSANPSPAPIATTIREGRHASFDRFVVQFSGGVPGYDVRYVQQVTYDASGKPVALEGKSFLHLVLKPAAAHSTNGSSTLSPTTLTPRDPSIRQVKLAGDFEGVLSFGIGVSATKGFHVFTLTNPSRVVIDVSH